MGRETSVQRIASGARGAEGIEYDPDGYAWLESHAIDPNPGPLEALILAEEAEARAAKLAERRRVALLPSDRRPTMLLMGCRAWPVPDDSLGRCGTCHGLAGDTVYCLCCDTPKGSMAGLAAHMARLAEATAGKPRTRKEKRKAARQREAA